jgi:hypothetical protein
VNQQAGGGGGNGGAGRHRQGGFSDIADVRESTASKTLAETTVVPPTAYGLFSFLFFTGPAYKAEEPLLCLKTRDRYHRPWRTGSANALS